MREAQFVGDIEPVAAAGAEAGGRPLADAVEREDRGLVERGRIERAGGVREVMLGEDDLLLVGVLRPRRISAGTNSFSRIQTGMAVGERAKAARRVGEIRLDQPIELQQRLVVEADVVDVGGRQPCRAQAVVDRLHGKPFIVFLAGEALFLRRGDHIAVDEQRGRGVVIERGNSEDGGHIRIGPTPVPWSATAASTGRIPSQL